jgi:dTDP-4-dehydrorhamnose reductase
VLSSREELDIADAAAVRSALDRLQPWAVVNAAGYVRVDDAEVDERRCFRENAEGPAVLAAKCARRGVPLVTFSSDLVFDGVKGAPYVESDAVAPPNVYGASKAEAELRVLALHPDALVVRTSAFFGPWDEWNFGHLALRELEAERMFVAANDLVVSPTYVPELVDTALDLLIDGESGIWHLANAGATTWSDFARMLAEAAGLDPELVHPRASAALAFVAVRPRYSALGTERGALLRSLPAAVERFVVERASSGSTFDQTSPGGMRVADWTTQKREFAAAGSQ